MYCLSLELEYMTCRSVFEGAFASGAETDDMKQVPTMTQLLMGTFKSTAILPMPSCKAPFTPLKQTELNFISCLALYNFDMSSVKHDPVFQSVPIFLEMENKSKLE